LLDDLLYKEKYSIERTNAWKDSYRSVLNRFDTTQTSWEGWNYIAFILIFPEKDNKEGKVKMTSIMKKSFLDIIKAKYQFAYLAFF